SQRATTSAQRRRRCPQKSNGSCVGPVGNQGGGSSCGNRVRSRPAGRIDRRGRGSEAPPQRSTKGGTCGNEASPSNAVAGGQPLAGSRSQEPASSRNEARPGADIRSALSSIRCIPQIQ